MENEIMTNPAQMGVQGAAAAMAQIAQVKEQMRIAKEFPRDYTSVHTRIMKACSRKGLAEVAVYKYPRGGQAISGPSIRLAEVIAQNYGNMDFGVRELSQRKGASVVESFCMDLETNVRASKTFEVPHSVQLKGGKIKILTDQRDIYEHAANYGARRLRACILQCLPGDLVEEATLQCKKTVVGSVDTPIEDRITKMITAFDTRFQITTEMIEQQLGRELKTINEEDLFDLRTIFTSLKDNQSKRSDWFKFKEEATPESVTDLEDAIDEESGEITVKGSQTETPKAVDKPVEKVKLVKVKKTTKKAASKKSTAKKPAEKKEPESDMMKQFNDQIDKDNQKK